MKNSTIRSRINKQLVEKIDIQLKKIGMNKVAMIIDRDFHGTTTYIRTLLFRYGKNYDIVSFSISGIFVGYCMAGLFIKDTKKIGEIGMIHISQPLRDVGLSSLLCFIQYRYLMDSNPDALHCEIADKTGKMLHIIQELKFTNSGEISEIEGHPIWIREFLTEEDRNTFKKQLESAIDSRLMTLSTIPHKIHPQADLIDSVNVDTIDFEQTVKNRLITENMSSPLRIVPFFGYIGSKIRLARLPKNEVSGYTIILEITNIDIVLARKFLEKNNVTHIYRVSTRKLLKNKTIGKIRIVSHPTWNISLLKQSTKKFAHIGKELLKLTN